MDDTSSYPRLGVWLVRHRVSPAELATITGLSRVWVVNLAHKPKYGDAATLKTMKLILWGARQLRGEDVQLADLFDLEPTPIADD